jgi:DNA sulfur modification protein DndC
MVGCLVFRPIVDLTTDDVWEFLATEAPPWGGSHSALVTLYRNSLGGECPVVVGKSDAPSCGTSSSRFGCWTCTVVQKDRSLEGFVEAGFSEFGPLLEFRDWLSTIRNDPARRSARRRNGKFTINDSGTFVPGPFTPDTRAEILARLLAVQDIVGRELISPAELAKVREIWRDDAMVSSGRFVTTALAKDLEG